YDGFLPVQLFDGTHEVRLRRVVQRACRLVQHQDVGLMIERTSDANALPLSAGELDATLAHDGVEPLRQASDEGRDLRVRKRVPDRLLVDDVVCEAKTYVATDGVVHEVDDLGDVPDALPPIAEILRDVVSVDRDGPAGGRQQPQQEVHQ